MGGPSAAGLKIAPPESSPPVALGATGGDALRSRVSNETYYLRIIYLDSGFNL